MRTDSSSHHAAKLIQTQIQTKELWSCAAYEINVYVFPDNTTFQAKISV